MMCKTTPKNIASCEKQALALEMRREGRTYGEIAQVIGCSKTMAFKHISAALKAIVQPGVEALRELENERYDVALRAIWPKVASGDLDSLHAFIRLSQRRCALLGLDMPVKVANTDSQGRDNPFMEISAEGLRQIAATVIGTDAEPTTPEE